MTLSASQKTNFRFDINALRCFAVVGVLLFHFKVPLVQGGFSGVDVFFVISGYLMTRIIINDLKGNKFNLIGFYNKRALRIIPALLALIIALLVAGFFIYFPDDYRELLKNAASAVLFFSNIRLYSKTNYFDQSADINSLLHTWSLSAEWQFYLIYPICLYVLYKLLKGKVKALPLILVATVALCIFGIKFTTRQPSASFYLLPSRAWEMLAGGLALYLEPWLSGKKFSKYLAWAGYLTIAAGYFLLNNKMPWPGVFTLVPTVSTMLIIAANHNDIFFLNIQPVQFFGKISYSLYLWHWPIFVLAQYRGVQLTWVSVCILLIVSVILGYLSFRFIESFKVKNAYVLYAAAGGMFAVLVLGFRYDLNTKMFKPRSIELLNLTKNYKASPMAIAQFSQGSCFIMSLNTSKDFKTEECLSILPGQKNILLIGDSHGADISASLREIFKKNNMHLLQATASGCSPLLNTAGVTNCTDVINYIYKDFIEHHADQIQAVIISAHWIEKGTQKGVLDDILNTMAYLKKHHLKTLIIGQTKSYIIPYPIIAAQEQESGLAMSQNFVNHLSVDLNAFLSESLGDSYLDIYELEDFPKVNKDNMPYMFDKDHFTRYGADQKIEQLWPKLVDKHLW